LCESETRAFQPYAEVRGWNYVSCANCGFVFLDPQPTPDELRAFYDSQYQYDPESYKNSIGRQKVWLDYLESAIGSCGSLLEVGCSFGYFLRAARQRGWTVSGVEPGGDATDFARRKLGLDVVKGTISDLKNDRRRFDAVVAWHVLEHDADPRLFLRITTDLLKPDGVLAIRVPNLDSTVSRLAGKTWQWLSPPEHVCMYCKSTLAHLFSEFELETIVCTSSRGNSRNIWFEVARARAKKLLNSTFGGVGEGCTTASFRPPPRYENRAWYRTVEQFFEIASWPVEAMVRVSRERAGKEAELVIFARKPARSVARGRP